MNMRDYPILRQSRHERLPNLTTIQSLWFLWSFPWHKVVANNKAIESRVPSGLKSKSSLQKCYGRPHGLVTEYLYRIWPHSSFITYNQLSFRNKSNMTVGARAAYPAMFCRSLFVLFSYLLNTTKQTNNYFFWP